MTPEQKIEYEAQGYLVVTDAFETERIGTDAGCLRPSESR